MLKQIIINFLGIFNSRILGFIRDLLSASILGANIYSDIFFVAFKFPNLFRRIFAEGAFIKSFLPYYNEAEDKNSFAFWVFVHVLGVILLLTLIVNLFPYEITSLIAYGFSEKAKELAAPLVAINFWYLDLIFIVTFFAALLNNKDHFFTTAFSTALLNISLIAAMLISKDLEKEEIIYYMSWGVVVGGILQVIAHLIAAKYKGVLLFFKPPIKKVDLSDFKRSFFHTIIGNSTAQISAFISTFLASFLSYGSISYLYYANRLFQLPYALFAIAISNVLFPKISKSIDETQKRKTLKKSFWYLLYTLTLATIVALIANKEIVKILFQRGEFSEKDSLITANVLVMYILGLIPFGLSKLFLDYLYSLKLHHIAKNISIKALLVDIISSIILIYPLKVYGLALASTLGGVSMFLLAVREFGRDEFLSLFDKRSILLLVLVIFGSIIIGYGFREVLIWLD